eukprot:COSAG02_NODE_20059_length_850_cov_1.043941_1_plen_48_part_10
MTHNTKVDYSKKIPSARIEAQIVSSQNVLRPPSARRASRRRQRCCARA